MGRKMYPEPGDSEWSGWASQTYCSLRSLLSLVLVQFVLTGIPSPSRRSHQGAVWEGWTSCFSGICSGHASLASISALPHGAASSQPCQLRCPPMGVPEGNNPRIQSPSRAPELAGSTVASPQQGRRHGCGPAYCPCASPSGQTGQQWEQCSQGSLRRHSSSVSPKPAIGLPVWGLQFLHLYNEGCCRSSLESLPPNLP